MKSVGQILVMILLLVSAIGYTVCNYLQGNTSQMMLVFSVALLGAALINMIQGLINAWKNK